METVLTIRIDVATQRKLDRLARARRTTRSNIVREAIDQLAAPAPTTGESAYTRVADLIGSVSSGRGDLSIDTGKKYAAMLRAKRRQ